MPHRIKFTKDAIERLPLPAAGERSTTYDTEVPKLAARVTSAGTRTFYVVKRDGASMAWVKLGTFPDMTVELARKAADKPPAEPRADHPGQQLVTPGIAAQPAHENVGGKDVRQGHDHSLLSD